MKSKLKLYDYRQLTMKNLTQPRYRHLLLVLYWPVYLLMFFFLERITAGEYHVMHLFLDDLIPFSEYFIVPYLFWFVYWIGMLFYCILYEIPTFKRTMQYLILTLTLSIIIFLLYPTSQELRPTEFVRDNVFTHLVRWIYLIDTNTNVCPSMHVIVAFGIAFAAYDTKNMSVSMKRVMAVVAVLISISTLFVKQHSAVDFIVALPICLLGYGLCFRRTIKKPNGKQ